MTKTWSIGNFKILGQTVLAPLAGIGDLPFRIICKKYGVNLIYTEFVAAQGLLHKNKETFKMLKINQEEHPIGIQLFGATSNVLEKAAQFVEEAGVDFVDLNCGCPEPKVVKTGSGAALLNDLDNIARIVEAMVRAVKIPVTVKTRIGIRKNEPLIFKLGKMVEDAGAAALAVNCCYVSQDFSGPYDWDVIGDLKRDLKIPIIGNGGIKNLDDAVVVLSKGASAVMIGRACFGAPWFFSQLNAGFEGSQWHEPSLNERFSVMVEHLNLEIEEKGEVVGVSEMRKHWAWYVKSLPGAAKFRDQAVHAKGAKQMMTLLESYMEQLYNRN